MRISLFALIASSVLGGPATAATLLVQVSAAATGVDIATGPVGGSSLDTISTNTASSSASATATASASTPIASASGFASANIASGQLKARFSANPGIAYSGIDSEPVWNSFASGFAQAFFSETFTAVGSGTVEFTMAYDGIWNLGAQTQISCCDPLGGIVTSFVDPNWLLSGTVTLGGGGVLASDQFAYLTGDILSGNIDGILSLSASLIDGQTYGISADLIAGIVQGSGLIDFSNTATLGFSVSSGLSLVFDDSRFLTDTPAPVPLPASGLLFAGALGVLGLVRKRKPKSV